MADASVHEAAEPSDDDQTADATVYMRYAASDNADQRDAGFAGLIELVQSGPVAAHCVIEAGGVGLIVDYLSASHAGDHRPRLLRDALKLLRDLALAAPRVDGVQLLSAPVVVVTATYRIFHVDPRVVHSRPYAPSLSVTSMTSR